MKKSYKIIIIIVLVVILGVGFYLVLKQIEKTSVSNIPDGVVSALPTDNTQTQKTSTSSIKERGEDTKKEEEKTKSSTQKLIKLSDGPIFDYWINDKNGNVFYLSKNGNVFIAKEGDDEKISDQQIAPLMSLEEGFYGEKALVSFGTPYSVRWGVFDSIDKVWRPLSSDIILATWGRDENSLVITKRGLFGSSLGFLNLEKTPPEYKNILPSFPFNDVRLSFISPYNLYITELPSEKYNGRAWLLNTQTKSLNTIRSGRKNFVLRWINNKSAAFLFSDSVGFEIFNGPNLNNPVPVPFSSIPQKCTSQLNVFYCFSPKTKDNNLFENYIKNERFSDDVLYIDDENSGSIEKIFLSKKSDIDPIDAKNPRVRKNYLYFINKYNNLLYRFRIKEPVVPVVGD